MFEHFVPKLSAESSAFDVLFLANIQPGLQLDVREQCARAKFVALDSMNLWIETARDSLVAAISEVDCLMLNDAELRQLTQEPNLVRAARGKSGCAGMQVDTFGFQAQPFYERMGFTVFGVQPNFPPGHRCVYLRKQFDGA